MNKGLIISMDALLAIFSAFIMLAIIFYLASTANSDSIEAEYLAFQAQNFAETLETAGILKESVEMNTTQDLVSVIENTPPNLCTSVVISNPEMNYTVNTIKSECETTEKMQFSVFRSFVADYGGKKVFGAKTTIWRKET